MVLFKFGVCSIMRLAHLTAQSASVSELPILVLLFIYVPIRIRTAISRAGFIMGNPQPPFRHNEPVPLERAQTPACTNLILLPSRSHERPESLIHLRVRIYPSAASRAGKYGVQNALPPAHGPPRSDFLARI